MDKATLNTLAAPLRTYGAVIFEGYEEPHAEILALLYGPHFDREHAQTLLERRPGYVPQVLHTVKGSADQYDRLSPSDQLHLRKLVVRHRNRFNAFVV
jgi:hypothetical protein